MECQGQAWLRVTARVGNGKLGGTGSPVWGRQARHHPPPPPPVMAWEGNTELGEEVGVYRGGE